MELEEKIVSTVYVNSRCLNKIFKTFLITDLFSSATGVNDTGGAP
jgi:hypothetical protein